MKPSPELIKLVDKSLNKTITKVEMAQLEDLLEKDDAMQYYLEMTSLEATLPVALQKSAPDASAVAQRKLAWFTYAAAAAVLFFVGLLCGKWMGGNAEGNSPRQLADTPTVNEFESSAVITSLIGVTWENETPDSLMLTDKSKPIMMKSGLMELTFASGVRTLVEGPAVIQVTGDNAALLHNGRMVADVPKGAEGFTVDYAGGKLIDLGTEFAINVPEDQKKVEVGVFRGEVEVYNQGDDKPLKILENHAIAYTRNASAPFASIPFHREQYIRKLPSREFPWELPKAKSAEATVLEFDVSHLVWKSGEYRAVVNGIDAIECENAVLLLDGKIIARDDHVGVSGFNKKTVNNTYIFSVPERAYKSGRWTLRIDVKTLDRDDAKAGEFVSDSSGILLFEDSQSVRATEEDFVGTWEYTHHGKLFQRVYSADHKAQLFINGKAYPGFQGATWKVKDGILELIIPKSEYESTQITERNVLRSEKEIIFVDQPYRNGLKVME